MHIASRKFGLLAAATIVLVAACGAAPATAQAAEVDFVGTIASQQLLGTAPASTVRSTERSTSALSFVPVAAAPGKQTEVPGVDPVTVYSARDHGVVVGTNDAGNPAAFTVITSPDAPESYAFDVEVGGVPAHLVPAADGSIAVIDDSGVTVNTILPPWATDADGADVPTWYEVTGDRIVQHVDHADVDAYPVVADPSGSCNLVSCSVSWNRAETHNWATAGAPALGGLTAGCAIAGPIAAAACAIASGAIVSTAIVADNGKKCLRFTVVTAVATWYPSVYSGGTCR